MTTSPLAAATSWLDRLADWVVALVELLGAPGIGVAVALENLFPPIPSEVVLPLAGFAASRGELSLTGAIVWSTVGSVVGALALFGLGRWYGRDRLRRMVDRLPLVDLADLDRAEQWFQARGRQAVFVGRFVPVVRSLVSVPAGVERMSPMVFVLLTTLGSGLWNTGFVLAGYVLGENYGVVERYAGVFSRVVVVTLVATVVALVVRRLRRLRRLRSGDRTDA